MTSN